ncbi:beta strand repeat-containing protein [Nostoc commune]|uniref:beta strand repeat-containing protein n=1 Tax=Nostoc commune TaxID=1178 RepID=UPI0018C52752|nr:SdrD B-like domain-containing protein [Nostoc commune]MBG1261092.1 hypothetical protein [Nostoc commune BAE]
MKSLFKNLRAIATLNEYGKSMLYKESNLNSRKRVAKLRQLQLGILSLIGVASVLVLPNSARAATTTLNFDDSSPNLVNGSPLSQGAVYRFKNVATGVDALVTLTQISNSELLVLDDNASFPTRFQPTIRQIGANQTSYIRFDFELVVSGTMTPTSVPNVYFSAQDVDGNGAANSVQEFVEFINSQVSYVPNPTLLNNVSPLAGGVRYQQTTSTNVQAGIGTDDRYEFYSYVGTSVSNFSIIGGSSNGTSISCNGVNTGCNRQNSWTFSIIDVQPLDFGDAPAIYGNASHPVPPAPTVYFGAGVDGDDAPNYSTNADGDDLAGSGDDENGVTSFPPLTTTSTTYNVTALCKGNISVAAWIDFNRNNIFDLGERTSGTCNNTSVTLNWTGLTGLSAGTTYARFRIATNGSEITNPSTTASNGEVEDYSLNITTSISGTVFDDSNGDKIQDITEIPTNAGGLNAVLVDSSNKVVATTAVVANGSYSFSNVLAATYTVQITTATATIGAAPPAITLPSGWVSTGENLSGVVDGTVDSKVSVSVTTTNVTGVNLGIERVPDTTNLSPASQTNPGGTATVQVPTLAGTDPEDGALGSGKTFKIVTLPTNGTLTYNGTAVTAGQIISSYNPALLQLDPNDGAIAVTFTYAAIDAAGKEDPTPATVTMPFTLASFSVSGTLYEDSDGGDDLDASEPKLPAAIKVTLYKDNNSNNTIDTGEEVANTATNDQGQYTFNNVAAGTYKVKVDTSDSDIPNGLTLGTSNDLTVTVSGAAVNNINFGFDRAQVSFDPDPPNPEADPNPPAGICAAPGSDGTLTISGIVNTYYPGTQSVSAGATQITLGTATGLNSGIKKGDKLLIIQMQDAEINSTNTDAYGNGNPGGAGSGSTAFYTSGYYEYVVANNTVSSTGGNLQISTPLAYTFTNADATSTRGQRRFQIIRLPQYRNATISGTVTAAPWNGRSGGIVAVDVADTLTFSGAGKIDVSGQGFRGGGGRNTTGTGGAAQSLPGNTDYVSLSTNPYHGSKGEGIAGTPKYIRNDVTTTVTVNSDEGYPNGSFGRGAPGNAGGGSTDPNIEQNAANSGGGGGANRGFGGKGGDSWTDGYGRQPVGGFGGQAFLATVNRIVMGGGGGAGTSNNSTTGNVPSGGGGGGIVMVRSGKIVGTGIIEANGVQGVEPSSTDGGGGGGAGGTVLIQSVTPSTPTLTINARGGKGLDSGYQEHGPGGGGGGGYIAFKGITPVIDVNAGQPGNDKAGGTVNPAPDPYGATAGANGLAEAATIPAAGVKPGAECFSNNPNVLLVKRITSINNQTQNQGSDDLAVYKDQDTNPYDDNNITITNPNPPVEPADTNKWPDPNTFLIGGINGGNVKPGDEIEYIIYFLSAGDATAPKVLICDRIPDNVSFTPTAFNSFATKNSAGLPSADRGIIWQYNGSTQSLTNTKDGDVAQYFPPGVEPSTVYNDPNNPSKKVVDCGGANTNGAIVVNLGDLPNATGSGTPPTSYGFIRFRGWVK